MEEEQVTGNEEQIEESVETDQEQQGQEVVQEDQQQLQESTSDPSYMYIESDQLDLMNHLISGQIFFMGLIFGAIIFKIFWDRWRI